MDFPQTVDWLCSKLPMFQRVGSVAFKKDLTNIQSLCEHLGNPHKRFKSIHIAGTNGKGSTSHMLASIFQEAGYKVGLTTSPHLKDFRERIRINGQMCSEEFIIDFVAKNGDFIEQLGASFFEVSIAMAFECFAQEKVDIAIIETGLGGRLDSTNIILPELSIITNIGLDHTAILGNTLAEIAFEKAGIIKSLTPVIIGETTSETKDVFISKAKEMNAEIILAENQETVNLESDLTGIYQLKNKKTVLTAISKLQQMGWLISDQNVIDGLLHVKQNTNLRGRWDILNTEPLTVADTAHNPHGLAEVIQQIQQVKYKQLRLVLGFVNDKDVSSILEFFPKDAVYYFCEPDVPRKLPIDELQKVVAKDLTASYQKTVSEAIKKANEDASIDDFIYIGGSTFVVAEAI